MSDCNKRFKSMRAVTMTAARHAVNFISYGKYDKKTGLKEINRPYLSLMNDNKELPKILESIMITPPTPEPVTASVGLPAIYEDELIEEPQRRETTIPLLKMS
jgi:hypothetical protein